MPSVPQQWLDVILPAVPGLTDTVARQHLMFILHDFLKTTLLWQETLPKISLVAGQSEYPLVSSYDADIVRVVYVSHKGEPFHPIDRVAERIGQSSGWMWDDVNSQLIVRPTPANSETDALEVTVALAPTDLSFPIETVDKWQNEIISGVLGQIFVTLPHLSGSNPTLGEWHLRRYYAARARARVQGLSLVGPVGYSLGRNALGGLA